MMRFSLAILKAILGKYKYYIVSTLNRTEL